MFGLKIFVRVQTFRRVPPVLPCNFCHPVSRQGGAQCGPHRPQQQKYNNGQIWRRPFCLYLLQCPWLCQQECCHTQQRECVHIRGKQNALLWQIWGLKEDPWLERARVVQVPLSRKWLLQEGGRKNDVRAFFASCLFSVIPKTNQTNYIILHK